MHGHALRVDSHGHGHVLDVELVDGFHAQVGEADHPTVFLHSIFPHEVTPAVYHSTMIILGIDPGLRGEKLTVADFIRLGEARHGA